MARFCVQIALSTWLPQIVCQGRGELSAVQKTLPAENTGFA
jgi:hypothetical protein